jgi:hypothetical protein
VRRGAFQQSRQQRGQVVNLRALVVAPRLMTAAPVLVAPSLRPQTLSGLSVVHAERARRRQPFPAVTCWPTGCSSAARQAALPSRAVLAAVRADGSLAAAGSGSTPPVRPTPCDRPLWQVRVHCTPHRRAPAAVRAAAAVRPLQLRTSSSSDRRSPGGAIADPGPCRVVLCLAAASTRRCARVRGGWPNPRARRTRGRFFGSGIRRLSPG